MEHFFNSDFIYKWQTLIGAALGPFLAVVLSAIVVSIRVALKNRKERKEILRRIEIGITQSLNDTYVLIEQLNHFSENLKRLAAYSRAITNSNEYFLSSVNFPPIREVYRNSDASIFKVKSYYLHNKIVFIDAGIKDLNETTRNLKNSFESLIQKNEMMAALREKPPHQRQTYANNLNNFVLAIQNHISQFIEPGIKIMLQVKVYNELIRRRWGWVTLWKYESTRFKYFKNKSDQKKFARNLDSLKSIDDAIEKLVQDKITEAETRKKKMKSQK